MNPSARLGVLTLLAGTVACETDAAPIGSISVSETFEGDVPVVTISGPVAALPEWHLAATPITEISGDAEPFLGAVGQVAFLGADRLLVEDRLSDELRIFGPDGRVEGLLAGRGDGPGELQGLTRLTVVPGDTVWTYDVRHSRLTALDLEGEVLATVSLNPEVGAAGTIVRDAWALGGDQFLVYSVDPGPPMPPTAQPVRVGWDGVVRTVRGEDGIEHDSLRISGGHNVRGPTGMAGSPFSNRVILAVGSDRLVTGPGLTYSLTLRDLELRPTRTVRWPDFGRMPLTPEAVESLREPMAASLHELRAVSPDGADRLVETLLNPEILPDTLPAIGSALLDDEGRIWVSSFRVSTDLPMAMTNSYQHWREEDVWHVLDADGRPLARVRLPADTRLLAVRSDRAATVTRDRFGVEHVRVWSVETGG